MRKISNYFIRKLLNLINKINKNFSNFSNSHIGVKLNRVCVVCSSRKFVPHVS